MLNQSIKSKIQTSYSQFLSHHQLRPRNVQKQMIATVANTLSNNNDSPTVAVIEAGTGTGKTLAYLVAALPIAIDQEKTLVVSTATINLQQQLIQKDLPDLKNATDLSFNYQLIKGRGRYLCNAKLDNLLSGDHQHEMMFEDGNVKTFTADALQLYREFETALTNNEWNGDRDQWHNVISQEHWIPLTSDRFQCSGRACPHVSDCAFFSAREVMETADCLVVNHDIVLSDLQLGGGVILPSPEDCIYVFDEAHHLAKKARNHFSVHCRLQTSKQQLVHINTQLKKLTIELNQTATSVAIDIISLTTSKLTELLTHLKTKTVQYFESHNKQASTVLRFPEGRLVDFLQAASEEIFPHYQQLLQQLTVLQQHIESNNKNLTSHEHWYGLIGQYLGYLETQTKLWLNYQEKELHIDYARWLCFHDMEEDIECLAAPILPASNLYDNLWSQCHAAILTSATLASLGTFEQLTMLCGIPQQATFQSLASPFDYHNNAVLRIAKNSDPRDTKAHTQHLIKQIPTLANDKEGTLVLFSSKKQMNEVFVELSPTFKKQVLLQETTSKAHILEQHLKSIDDNQSSTIFGLDSFAEGIDLPGKYCSHVIIAKIPFTTPDNPIEEALGEWVEAQGYNSFTKISLPDASLRLIQATGRLIRTETDSGVITIFDDRLISKSYGKQLLSVLPPYRIETINFT